LRSLPSNASAAQALEAIRADVHEFVAGAPSSDDVTLLVLRWRGEHMAMQAPEALTSP
jgi:serine phosphatase RsbU (regulator of sigma subunit)